MALPTLSITQPAILLVFKTKARGPIKNEKKMLFILEGKTLATEIQVTEETWVSCPPEQKKADPSAQTRPGSCTDPKNSEFPFTTSH